MQAAADKNPHPQLKRRKLFIATRFQVVFILYSIAMSVIPLMMVNVTRAIVASEMNVSLTMVVAVATVTLLFVLGASGFVLSHRLAGPLYRIEKHLEDVASGKTTEEIKLREGDFFQELAMAANRVIRKLNGKN